MSLSRYPDYKHSGVDWLGEIPSHWKIERFKNVLDLRKITVGDTKGDYTLLSLTLQGVIARDMVNPKGKFPAEFDTYQVVEKDDLVFCLFDVEETPRAVGISPCTGMVTGAYTVGRAKVGTSAQYLYNFYLSRDQHKAFKMYYTGLRNVIRSETFNAIPCPVPPIDEQIGISNFLEKETAKIDMLVEQQEKLIELLKEKRKSIISHTVTKGLDPTVKMKDSGVEWLGEIPDHWSMTKVSRGFLNIGSGTTPPSDETQWYEGGTIPWITTGELRESLITDTQKFVTQKAIEKFTSLALHPAGSLAIAMYGATIGRLAILGIDAVTNQACCVLSGPTKIQINYAFYWFQAFKQNIIEIYASGGGQPNINQQIISSLKISCPSTEEQENIIRFLDSEISHINLLILKIEKAIDLLQERRSTLISAAVTGQIDVRNYQPKEAA